MGGDDFSAYLDDAPGCYAFIGAGPRARRSRTTIRASRIDERALATGVRLHVDVADAALKEGVMKLQHVLAAIPFVGVLDRHVLRQHGRALRARAPVRDVLGGHVGRAGLGDHGRRLPARRARARGARAGERLARDHRRCSCCSPSGSRSCSRRGRDMDLEQWSVGGRGFGSIFVFLLMAGEIYSTFTFLGGAGLVYGSGGAAYYILGYGTLAYILVLLAAAGGVALRDAAQAALAGRRVRQQVRLAGARRARSRSSWWRR